MHCVVAGKFCNADESITLHLGEYIGYFLRLLVESNRMLLFSFHLRFITVVYLRPLRPWKVDLYLGES